MEPIAIGDGGWSIEKDPFAICDWRLAKAGSRLVANTKAKRVQARMRNDRS